MRKSGVNATALFGLLAMSSSNAFADDQDVRLDQVPARVRQAIEKEVKDGQITEIQREMGARNRVVYEVEYTAADGTRYELDVAEDGTILKRERD